MGTLAAELAGKKIKTFSNLFHAAVTGDIEDVDGILKITRINVDYSLKLSEEKHSDAAMAFDSYLPKCPGPRVLSDA